MRILLRVFAGLLIIGIIATHWALRPEFSTIEASNRLPTKVSVKPLPLQIYCPGAFVELGGQSGVDLGAMERIGEALVSSSYDADAVLQSPPLSSVEGFGLVADSEEQSTNLVSIIQSQVVERERARGLAATYCSKPSSSGWLINGSSVVGSESVLLIANPNQVEAAVSVDFYLNGSTVSEQIALAPFEQKILPTAAFANAEPEFAVFFQSSGPKVSVSLQNRQTNGLQPTGVEIESFVKAPATKHIFAGFQPLTQGFENPTMRIFNPGSNVAEAVITAFGSENIELFRQTIPANSFETVELVVGEGYQLVSLEATSEVLAAIENRTIDPILDFAWIQSAEIFTSVSLPLSPYRNSLVIANPEASAVEVEIELDFGNRFSVDTAVIAPFSQLVLPVSADGVKVTGDGPFAIALEILDPLGYAVLTPTESRNLGTDLQIIVR